MTTAHQHPQSDSTLPPNPSPVEPFFHPAPTLPLLHATALLTGLGTFLLGPILPLLATRWHLDDAHTGTLLLAQFCGSFLGGITTSHRLRAGTLEGLFAAAAGLATFAFAPSLTIAATGLALGGFGIGRVITTSNILAGRRALTHSGAALARLNLTWSLGALLSPIFAATLTPHLALKPLLATFAAAFLIPALWLLIQARNAPPEPPTPTQTATAFPQTLFLYFLALLFLYGGLETSLSAWLTTYALRYNTQSSAYILILLLIGLVTGRAASSWLLLHLQDRTLVRIGLALSIVLTTALALNPTHLTLYCLTLGFTLSPIFPATFSLLLTQSPPARKAGIVLAASGLGAAAVPWLMGVLSTRAHSLQLALVIPVAAALLMLAFVLKQPAYPHPDTL